ncbi:MAG: hypothetical protein ACFFDP_03170 [Promethearchaeota archaeon]
MTSPEKELDPRYMRGVIDALELVISFIDWKDEHPESDRSEKEFIRKALQKLGTKIEQKLDRVLGLDID